MTRLLALFALAVALGGCNDPTASDPEPIGRLNHACDPARPVRIDHYGAGWSNGPYWKVRCPDGSVRIVQ